MGMEQKSTDTDQAAISHFLSVDHVISPHRNEHCMHVTQACEILRSRVMSKRLLYFMLYIAINSRPILREYYFMEFHILLIWLDLQAVGQLCRTFIEPHCTASPVNDWYLQNSKSPDFVEIEGLSSCSQNPLLDRVGRYIKMLSLQHFSSNLKTWHPRNFNC